MGLAWLRGLNLKDHGQDAHATFAAGTAPEPSVYTQFISTMQIAEAVPLVK